MRRAGCEQQTLRITRGQQTIPSVKQFRKLLTNGPFKQALVEFLFQEWQNCDPQILRGITVHLAHGAMCHSFTESEGHMYVNEVVELQCDHEEADSRLFLHAANVFLEHPKVEMRCSDTDVLVIAVSLQSKLSGKTFMLRGTASNRKLVNIAAIVDQLPYGIPEALIGLHVFTGCDSTSSFKGRGKRQPLQVLLKNVHYASAFTKLGRVWELASRTIAKLERFVCLLYRQNIDSLDIARHRVFVNNFRTDSSLPPTQDEFLLHAKRVNYQAAIHRRAVSRHICAPPPGEHGWIVEDDSISMLWMTKPTAPECLLQNAFCSCQKTACSNNQCSCRSKGVDCSELCGCLQCRNRSNTNETTDEGELLQCQSRPGDDILDLEDEQISFSESEDDSGED